ncbi:MAG: M20 family metallo-hydrolase [Phascolarctobacterium sp.]|nr:M20 family metallo-hydrolase [Phascolarctobacterium sp.]
MLAVNKDRVNELLMGLGEFGKTDQGVTRLAYSDEDRTAQNWLLEKVADLGLVIREDAVGNVFLRRVGEDDSLSAVATGSHLDTVIHGGIYDGMCGIVGALEALYMLQDTKLKRSVEVIIFRAEESSRFGFATIGSKLITGNGSPESFSKAAKKGELSYIEALENWGCNPANYKEAIVGPNTYKSFSEIHIEQGKVLEETGKQVGIVHNIAAPTRFKIHIKGMADHSGATPMGFRKDALVSGAKLILAVEAAATAEKDNGTVGTVGVVDVEPSSINVVPGGVTLWVDVRGVNDESIARTLEAIKAEAKAVAESDGVAIEFEMLTADKPVALSEELAKKAEAICEAEGIDYLHMNSGAGHDAMHMAKLAPTTMIFIPCKEGISHNPAEFAKNEDICRAVEVLAKLLESECNE